VKQAILTLAICFPYVAFVVYVATRLSRRVPVTVSSFEKLKGIDAMMTLSDGRQLRGSGTVWNWFPSGKRASTSVETLCADEWARQMWAPRKEAP
jgi:hypothetical protein